MKTSVRKSILCGSRIARLAACAALLVGGTADAQLALPPLQTPSLPAQLPDIGQPLGGVADATAELTDARSLRIRELLRRNRRVLEADPHGAPIMRREVLAYSPTPAVLDAAVKSGFTIAREQVLKPFDVRIVVLLAPPGMATRKALARLRELDPQGAFDFNHIYLDSGAEPRADASSEPALSEMTQTSVMPSVPSNARVGLIDTGIDRRHPALTNVSIHTWGCDGRTIAAAHGTGVASILVGDAPQFKGAVPGAALYAADVYCDPPGGAVDTIVAALAWLAQHRIAVINVSLVGPPNLLLERVVARLVKDGYAVVAAVGNDGPASPPLYPAAYPGVIGVTGVDRHRRVILEAVRGKQVLFAAPGADMAAAGIDVAYVKVRGTSFAAPIVAGLLAQHLAEPDAEAAHGAVEALKAQAVDLGVVGTDTTYGIGLVGESVRVAPDKELLALKRQ